MTSTRMALVLAVAALVMFIVGWVLRPAGAPDPLPSPTVSGSASASHS